MKEFSWGDCLKTNSSLGKSPDKAKAKSLLDTVKGRNSFLKSVTLIESNANFVFEGYYSSVLEVLHALVILKGYSVSNHICLGFYLRDVLNRNDLFTWFDGCRFNRNSLVYYGRGMDFEVAKDSIVKCKKLISELESYIR